MDVPGTAAFIAALIGAGLGLTGLLNPQPIARFVGLDRASSARHGVSEFRATYGGFFLLSHGAVAFGLGTVLFDGPGGFWAGTTGAGALVLALGWFGAAIGRLVSIFADRANVALNWGAVAFEIAMGAALLAPWWAKPGG